MGNTPSCYTWEKSNLWKISPLMPCAYTCYLYKKSWGGSATAYAKWLLMFLRIYWFVNVLKIQVGRVTGTASTNISRTCVYSSACVYLQPAYKFYSSVWIVRAPITVPAQRRVYIRTPLCQVTSTSLWSISLGLCQYASMQFFLG